MQDFKIKALTKLLSLIAYLDDKATAFRRKVRDELDAQENQVCLARDAAVEARKLQWYRELAAHEARLQAIQEGVQADDEAYENACQRIQEKKKTVDSA